MRTQISNRFLPGVSLATVAALLVLQPQAARAQGYVGTGTVTLGSATITPSANTTTVSVAANSPSTTINWVPTDTAIGGGAVNFLPSGNTANYNVANGTITNGSYTVLNRIIPTDATRTVALNGNVNSTSNINVWFYSPGGLLIGSTARFNVGGLLLSTSEIVGRSDGNLVSDSRQFSVAGTAGSQSAITIASGAELRAEAMGKSNYIVAVAPKIEQNGLISVRGSAALVAAESANFAIDSNGLFNIAVTQGSTVTTSNAFSHTGVTGGPDAAPTDGFRRVYMVAVPKNDAITMMVESSGALGFAVAGAANVQGNTIVLSAGHNIADTGVGDPIVAANARTGMGTGTGEVNLTLGTSTAATSYTSSLLANATGSLTVGGALSGTGASRLSLSGANTVAVNASITNSSANASLVLRADNDGTGAGTVTFASGVSASFAGAGSTADVYYNPATFGTPTAFGAGATEFNVTAATRTAYQLVNSATNLQAVGGFVDQNFALGRNIDATSITNFVPIGTEGTPFTGKFDGQNYVISNLTITAANSAARVGLFGRVLSTGWISRVGLMNVTISGGSLVGALVGLNEGQISQSFVGGTSSVTAFATEVGGLVGRSSSTASISSSFSTANVSGAESIGGLVGQSFGTISDSYATGTVTGTGQFTGGLVGLQTLMTTGAAISNSYATGAVTSSFSGSAQVGGLVGGNGQGSITGSYATGNVTGSASSDSIGGLVGQSDSGVITNSSASGAVSGGSFVGGLIGRAAATTGTNSIMGSFASGAVSGSIHVGGLVGSNDAIATISQSYATGAVSGASGVGGLVGTLNGSIDKAYASGAVTVAAGSGTTGGGLVGNNGGSITIAYATGAVTGGAGTTLGGLVGMNNGAISLTYASGAVSGGTIQGGLVGLNDTSGTITNSYWDRYSTGLFTAGVGTDNGTTTALNFVSSDPADSAQTFYAYKQSAYGTFNFTSGGDWVIYDGFTRPLGRWEIPAVSGGVRTITNSHQLQLVSQNLGDSYVLANNIDLSETGRVVVGTPGSYSGIWAGTGFVPIGSLATGFAGSFDGRGFTLSNLTINRPTSDEIGLFGHIAGTGSVSRLGLTGAAISGRDRVGALAGGSDGAITRSSSTGSVTGTGNYTGGLVGNLSSSTGTISQSNSSATVSGVAFTGGLVGRQQVGTRISNSFATGNVSGSFSGAAYVGGLVGADDQGMITASYATGSVTGSATSDSVGGLVGQANTAFISTSHATGAASGQNFVGGLVGNTLGTNSISQAYATGAVTGTSDVGGLVGSNSGSITQTYAVGVVTGTTNVGRLIGSNAGTITASYFNTTVGGSTAAGVGTTSQAGVTGLTTTQMQDINNFRTNFAGFDFDTVWAPPGDGHYPELYTTSNVVSVTPDNFSRIYGDANPVFTATYRGVRTNDTITNFAMLSAVTPGTDSMPGSIVDPTTGVGMYAITATGVTVSTPAVGGAYRIITVPGTLTIQQRRLDVTYLAVPASRVYGNVNPTFVGAFATSNLASFDTEAQVVNGAGLTFLSPANLMTNVGQAAINGSGVVTTSGQGANYFINPIQAAGNATALTITARPVTITYTANPKSRVYGNGNPLFDGAEAANTGTSTSGVGLVNGAVIGDVSQGTAVYNAFEFGTMIPVTTATNAGSHAILGSGLSAVTTGIAANYVVSFAQASANNTALTITQRPLDVTYFSNTRTRVYGDNNPPFSGTFSVANNFVNGDTQAQVLTGTAVFTTTATNLSNVGFYAINGSGIVTTSSTQGSNYFVNSIQAPGNATALQITQRTLLVSANSKTRVYGNENPALTFSSAGLITEDQFAGGLATVATAASNVGSYEITQGTLTVVRRTGFANAGADVLANYNLLYANNFLDITPRALTVTYSATPSSRQYGDANSIGGTLTVPNAASATATTGLAIFNGVADTRADVLTGMEVFATTATATSNVGSYAITGSGVSVRDPMMMGSRSGNYTVTFEQAPANATALTITRRLIDVTANAQTRIYGEPNPTLTFTTSSLGAGAPVQGMLATVATPTTSVGTVAITEGTVTNANNSNYLINYIPGTGLTITQRPIDVTYIATGTSRVYGDNNPTFNGSFIVSNLANGEAQAAVVTGPAVFTSTATRLDNIGQYAITGAGVMTNTMLGANYFIRSEIQGAGNATALTITPRPLLVQANAQSRVYGNANPSLAVTTAGVVTSTGLIVEDRLTGMLATTAVDLTSNVGRYDITRGGLSVVRTSTMANVFANYSLTFINSFLDITPRALTLSYVADAQMREYGDTNPPLTGGLAAATATANTGLVNSDTELSVTAGSTAVFDSSATVLSGVGSYAITGSGAFGTSANYTYNFVQAAGNTTALTITPRLITVTPNSQTRLYGADNPTLTFTVARTPRTITPSGPGLVNNDTLTGGLVTTATTLSNVGLFDIERGSLAASPNYVLTYAGGTNLFSITPRPLTITYTADFKVRTYGDANPAFTGAVNAVGLVNGDTVGGATRSVTTGAAMFGAFDTMGTTPVSVMGLTAVTDLTNVGSYAVLGSGLTQASSNYIFTFAQTFSNFAALSIQRRALNVVANAQTRVYGNANPALTFQTTGLISADSFANGLVTTAVSSTVSTPGSDVGSYAITQPMGGLSVIRTAGGADVLGNYNLSFIGANLTITPRLLTVSYDAGTPTREYGDTNPSFGGMISAVAATANTGLAPGDLLGAVTNSAALAFASAAEVRSNTGSYAITGSGAFGTSGNYTYNFVQAAGNATALTITPRLITVTADPKSRLYGDSNPALTFTVTRRSGATPGLVNNDSLTGGLATTANALSNVGNVLITRGNLAASANYDLAYVGENLTITQRPLVLTYNAAPASRIYGEDNQILTGTVTGNNFVNGDTVVSATSGMAVFTAAADRTTNVGSYAITGSGLTPLVTNNYAVTFAQAAGNATAFTITPRALQITYTATANTRIYGDPNPAFAGTLSATGLANSDTIASVTAGSSAIFTTPATVRSDVGRYAINGSGLVGSSANYTYSFQQAAGNAMAFNITPRLLTVTYNADPRSRLYGDANPLFTGTLTVDGLVNEQTLTTITSGTAVFGSTATVLSNVGSYAVEGSGLTGVSSNYTYSFLQNAGNATALTVNSRPLVLTYTATPATRIYGEPNPALTGVVTGDNFVNGNTVATVTTGTAAFTTGAVQTSNVGSYAITGSGLTANTGNYTVSFAQAASNATAFSITPRALQITYTATANTRIYGDANPAFAGTLSAMGLANSDTIASVTAGSAAIFTTPATVRSDIGLYAINGSGLVGSSANYTYSFVQAAGNATAFNITPRLLTITYNADSKTRLYGDANPLFTGSVTSVGLANEQTLTTVTSGTAAFRTTANGASNVGNYFVEGFGLAGVSSNYTYVFQQAAGNSMALSITPRPLVLTYTATPATRIYGEPNPALTGVVTGDNFVNGNTVATVTSGTAVFATSATQASNVGTYAVNGSGLTANSANYTISFAQNAINANALSITPRALQITYTATANTRIYGDANPAFAGTLSATGLANSDTIASVTAGSSAVFGTAATVRSDVGAYAINGSGLVGSSANYTYSFLQAAGNATAFTITPRLLTITYNADTKTRLYGDSNPALTGSVTAVGLVNEQALVTVTSGSAVFATLATGASDVGNYAINGSGISGLSSNYSYVFQQATGNSTALSITPRPLLLTYTADTKTRIYGDANPALTGIVTGDNLVNGNTVATVTSGTAVFATSATAASNVGSFAVNGSGLNANSANYTISFAQNAINATALSITPRALQITYTATANTRIFGDANPAFAGTLSANNLANSDTIASVTAGSAAVFTTPATVRSDVGLYAINGSGLVGSSANYTYSFVQAAGNATAFSITPRLLTVTYNADPKSRLFGDANPALTGSLTVVGLVNEQTLTTVTSGAAVFNSTATALSNVGSYAITGSGLTGVSSNYTYSFLQNAANATALSVTPRPLLLTYTADTKTRIYGDANPALTGVVTGDNLVNGNTVATVTSGTAVFATSATAASNVGSFAVNGSGLNANSANYTISFAQNAINATALSITPRALQITYTATANTRIFGDANPAFAGTLSANNLANSDTIASVTAGSAAVFGTTATVRSDVGAYAINGSGLVGSSANYTYSFLQAAGNATAFTITPRLLTITYNADTKTRLFGDANPALTGSVTAVGLVNEQALVTVTSGSAVFGTPATVASDVGNYAITGSGISGLSSNYTYVFQQGAGNSTALSVTPRPLLITYTADTKTRIYGDTNPPLTGTATAAGLVNGNTLGTVTSGSASFATLADERSNVGTYTITGSGLNATSGNYAYTFVQDITNANALSVTRRTVVVNAEPSTRIYGDANPAFTFRSGGLVNGDTFTGALATPADVRSNVGIYDILQGTLALSTNYNINYIKSTLDITPRALTLTADAQTRIYGNANPALTFVIGGRGLVNGDVLTGGLTTVANVRSDVGSYLIAQGSLAATTNYAVTYVSNQLAVTPRALTLTANAQTRIYGNANPDLTFVIGGLGLVNGDVLTGGLATPADVRSNIGTYAINQGSLAATTNYAVTYVGNNLVVTPRAITVTADAQTRVYGDANPALTFRVGGLGLVNGDTLFGSQVTTADVRSNVGTYGINRGTLNASPNYTVTYTGSNLTVTPRPLLVTGDDATRMFGDANPAFTFTVGASGLVNGDVLTGSLATPAVTGSPVGTYAITQGTLVATPNYTLTYRNGRLTVIPCTSGPGCVTAETVANISSEISSTVQDGGSSDSDEADSESGSASPKINISATINTQNVNQIAPVTEPITGSGNITLWATVDVEQVDEDGLILDEADAPDGASDGGATNSAADGGNASGDDTADEEEKKKNKGKKPGANNSGGSK